MTSSDGEEWSNGSDRTWKPSSYIKHSSDSLDESSSDEFVISLIEKVDDFVAPTDNNDDNLPQNVISVVNDLLFAIEQAQNNVTFDQVQEVASSVIDLGEKHTHLFD